MIQMADGSQRDIKDIRLLDQVRTAERNAGTVTHLFVREHNGEMCNLILWGHSHLWTTPEHPILTQRGYVPIAELTAEDWVAVPRRVFNGDAAIRPDKYFEPRYYAQAGGERRYAGVAGRKEVIVTHHPLPESIPLNSESGTIFGLFLAEGSTDEAKVVWTFNIDEEATLVAELLKCLKNQWGIEGRIQKRGEHSTIKVTVYGTGWARLFESLCGTGAGEKGIHADLASGSEEFLTAVFRGWMSGDGYASRRLEKDHGVTVSKRLALDMYSIANGLGLRPVINRSDPKPSHGVIERRERWDIKCHSLADNFRVQLDAEYMWRRVRSIERKLFSGMVYNIEVQGDNSYISEGIAVHNCVSFGFGRGTQDLILGQIASGAPEQWPGAEVATEPIYAGSRVEVGQGRIRGDGSVGAWASQWVQRWGILFRQKYAILPGAMAKYDLSTYSESLSRDWGRSGVPNDLEPIARQHPVRTVAQINTAAELWTALGNGYPVPVCSDVGFEGSLPADGIMSPRGSWGHCMLFRGRFVSPTKGKCVVVQNSWGGYLRGLATVETTDRGRVELPEGCFAITLATAGRMVAQRDTFALSGFAGFPKRVIVDWPVQRRPRELPAMFAAFDLAR